MIDWLTDCLDDNLPELKADRINDDNDIQISEWPTGSRLGKLTNVLIENVTNYLTHWWIKWLTLQLKHPTLSTADTSDRSND